MTPENLSEEDLKRLKEMEQQFQTEEAHGDGMEVNVNREPSGAVSTSVSSDEPGLDLSFSENAPEPDKKNPEFPSAEEAKEAFMSEEEQMQNKIAELESQAKERESRIKQKQHLRELKKRLRSAKVKEAVAPAAEKLEPVVSAGRNTADLLGRTGEKGAAVLDRLHQRNEEKGIKMGFNKEGNDFILGSSGMGLVGQKNMSPSVNDSPRNVKANTKKRTLSDVLQKKENTVGFSDKKGSMFSFGKKKNAVDWGAKKDSGVSLFSDKKSGISFDSKPGSGFSLFGEEKKSKKKKSGKKKDSLDINLILKGGK